MSTKEEVFKYVMNSPENTNPAVLGSLLNGIKTGGGGGELPDVTTDDNGKVLTVVNGEWGASVGNNPLIYDGSYVDGSGKIFFNSSATEKDLYDAFMAGANLIIQVQDYDSSVIPQWDRVFLRVNGLYQPGTSQIVFTGYFRGEGSTVYYRLVIKGTSTAVLGNGIDAVRYVVNDPI